jgi:mannose/cellobiose epimerase-like protein (N-acyl-D-glucosamine 2-epimerase family)
MIKKICKIKFKNPYHPKTSEFWTRRCNLNQTRGGNFGSLKLLGAIELRKRERIWTLTQFRTGALLSRTRDL